MAPQGPAVDSQQAGGELAVARSLDPARARAEKRVQRFLDAALELMSASESKDFTVQQVVERSGQSLRSFYQYFAGKYELLLALFEESVRTTAEHLGEVIDGETDPLERLRLFLAEYYRVCSPRRRQAGAQGLAQPGRHRRVRAAAAHRPPQGGGPGVRPARRRCSKACSATPPRAGVLRSNLDHRRLAGVLLNEIMFNAFAATISGTSVRKDADDLWDLVLHGIAAR